MRKITYQMKVSNYESVDILRISTRKLLKLKRKNDYLRIKHKSIEVMQTFI